MRHLQSTDLRRTIASFACRLSGSDEDQPNLLLSVPQRMTNGNPATTNLTRTPRVDNDPHPTVQLALE
jgi:hypothetical protein